MTIAVIAGESGRILAVQLSNVAFRDLKDRAVDRAGVISVGFILGQEFPVGLGPVLEKTRCQFDLARWRIVAQLIDRRLCSPQMLFERGTFGRHGTEHKAAVTRYARYFSKADTGFRNAFVRSEEHTSELQSLMRNSYAVFCLKK